MRTSVALALISILLSSTAFGADKKHGKKEEEKGAGHSMDTGSDPADSEKSDRGPYAPESEGGEAGASSEEGGEKAKKKEPVIEKKEMVKPRARDKFVLFGEVLIGFGRAPRPGPADSQTGKATLFGLQIGGAYDIAAATTLGLRIPFQTASVEQANRVKASATAFGSPEIFGEQRVALSPFTTLPVLFGVGIPVAQGNPDLTAANDRPAQQKAEVNALADAMTGWRDGSLYGPKRLPIVLGVGIRHERAELDLHAWTKFAFGIDLGTKIEQPQLANNVGTLSVNKVALRSVTLAGIAYEFTRAPTIWAGLDTWLVINAIDPIKYDSAANATAPSRLQFAAEPRVGARFGNLRPSLGFIFPIGGRLADAGATGIRLHADYAF